MPAEITMPQLSDTMKEGTLVRWIKKEGDRVAEGDIIAEVETDKANMEMEAFDAGVIAQILVKEGEKADVGAVLAVVATGKENPEEVRKSYGAGGAAPKSAKAPEKPAEPAKAKSPEPAPAPVSGGAKAAESKPAAAPARTSGRNQFDLIVIGGGPAGYAAAIRAGQLKKRVLCVEKENLGGTCLNWGCIPTKALLEDGNFVRKIRTEASAHGITFRGFEFDFSKMIARSRGIADKLAKGIAHLLKKYLVQHEKGEGTLLGANRVRITTPDGKSKEVTADNIIIAVGARATQLPGMEFDGKKIISAREAMTLPAQPKRLAIVGAGAIGCEFADFYNAVGTEVILVEMADHLLPIEDPEVSVMLERVFSKRGIQVHTKTKTDRVEKTANGVKLHLSGAKATTVEADVLLVAAGVTGNVEKASVPESGLAIVRNRVKVDPLYQTSVAGVWAVGDCIALEDPKRPNGRHPDLAHVAHHEAVSVVERIFGHDVHPIDYNFIPGCTYTHPQVASFGLTEAKAREAGHEIKVGKFPFSVSGRALAAGETDGFVKLIFDARYGELLGVHMIGEHVTELLAELVLARKLEATEAEIIDTMHPHPTLSEAVMEAAGVADGRAIHL